MSQNTAEHSKKYGKDEEHSERRRQKLLNIPRTVWKDLWKCLEECGIFWNILEEAKLHSGSFTVPMRAEVSKVPVQHASARVSAGTPATSRQAALVAHIRGRAKAVRAHRNTYTLKHCESELINKNFSKNGRKWPKNEHKQKMFTRRAGARRQAHHRLTSRRGRVPCSRKDCNFPTKDCKHHRPKEAAWPPARAGLSAKLTAKPPSACDVYSPPGYSPTARASPRIIPPLSACYTSALTAALPLCTWPALNY